MAERASERCITFFLDFERYRLKKPYSALIIVGRMLKIRWLHQPDISGRGAVLWKVF